MEYGTPYLYLTKVSYLASTLPHSTSINWGNRVLSSVSAKTASCGVAAIFRRLFLPLVFYLFFSVVSAAINLIKNIKKKEGGREGERNEKCPHVPLTIHHRHMGPSVGVRF